MWVLALLAACGLDNVIGGKTTVDTSVAAQPDWARGWNRQAPQLQGGYAGALEPKIVSSLDRAVLICTLQWSGDWDTQVFTDCWANVRPAEPLVDLKVGKSRWVKGLGGPFNTHGVTVTLPAVTMAPDDILKWELSDWDLASPSDYIDSGQMSFVGQLPMEQTVGSTSISCQALYGEDLLVLAKTAVEDVDQALQDMAGDHADPNQAGLTSDVARSNVEYALQDLASVVGWDAPEVQDRMDGLVTMGQAKAAEAANMAGEVIKTAHPFGSEVILADTRWKVEHVTCGLPAKRRYKEIMGDAPSIAGSCLVEASAWNNTAEPMSELASSLGLGDVDKLYLIHADGVSRFIGGQGRLFEGRQPDGFFDVPPGGRTDQVFFVTVDDLERAVLQLVGGDNEVEYLKLQ
jgi:hypothetical protein